MVSIVPEVVLWWHEALISDWGNESKMVGDNVSLLVELYVVLNKVLSAVYLDVKLLSALIDANSAWSILSL